MSWKDLSHNDRMAFEAAQARALPCPFCGQAPFIRAYDYGRDVTIGCICISDDGIARSNNQSEGPYSHLEEALAIWNRRSP